jgi:cardiolipin synthase A/B
MFKRVKSAKNTSAYTPGNSVKLIRGGAEYFDLLEKFISTARHTIHFQVYIYDDDPTGNRISAALKEAALRGVKVYVMLDAYASKNLSKAYIKDLTSSGIHFKWFAPILKGKKFYLGRRLHHKVVVTDSYYCLVAGLNISDRYNDTPKGPAWLDWALYAEGSIGEVLATTCIRRYKARLLPTLNDKPKSLSMVGLVKNCAVRARSNDWIGRKKEISQSYLEMFETAKHNIIIMSPYFLPGAIFRKAIKAAAKRGVKIKVILAGLSDIGTSKYAERYLYRWLFKNSIEIFEYSKTVLHGKIAVCDTKWVTIGSYNLNNLSAYASVELNLDIADTTFAKNTEGCLSDVIEKECEQITEEEYCRTTSWLGHVMQKLAYNVIRLIAFFVIKKRE